MLTVKLVDWASDTELADLTEFCQTKKVSPRLNRPRSTTVTLPGDTPALRDTSFDGRPNCEVGRRLLKIYSDAAPGDGLVANSLIWLVGPSGDENTTSVEIAGYDPLILLPYRLVQEADGTFADPKFASPISGAEILQQALQNTIANDGALPIDLTGPIASSVDLAADLANWPMTIADLFTMLTDTGALDALINPVDTHNGAAAGVIGQLTAADHLGQDLSGTVSFDYATGLHNVAQIRRTFDMSTLCNKLWYFLGPKGANDNRHYHGNITATETGAAPGSEDLAAYQALQQASQDLYGVYMDAKVYDDAGTENEVRKLFHVLWKTEVTFRVKPRELLYMTPVAGNDNSTPAPPFRPFRDYNVGDKVGVTASDIAGPALAGSQRIYGFDVEEGTDGVERVGEFITTADGV